MSDKLVTIVPWDFSNHSRLALEFALQQFGADSIKVICVLERPNPYLPGMNWGEEAEANARQTCENQFFDVVQPTDVQGLEFTAVYGEPADEIVHLAHHHDECQIVISTHGRTGFDRLLMGSVAQKVAGKAKCPLVLLPNGWFETQLEQPDH